MKYLFRFLSLIGILAISLIAYSGPTNAAGLSSIKDDVDTNTTNISINESGIADNAFRISALESGPGAGGTPDYSGYDLPFAANDATKNVVVLKLTNSDGSGFYQARIHYANLTEQISSGGVNTTPLFIAKVVRPSFNTDGVLIGLSSYIRAPMTAAFLDFIIEQSTYNITTKEKSVFKDTRSELKVCSGLGVIEACDITVKTNGVPSGLDQLHGTKRLLGSGSVGGMSFSDLLGRERVYNSFREFQVHAKGIGEIMRLNSNGRVRKVIYYNVNGATGGSLVGTPFDTGQLFSGFFF